MAQAAKTEKNEDKILAKLREICLALPGVQEVKTWGHPTFQAGKKSFAVLDEYHGQLCICLKMTLPLNSSFWRIDDSSRLLTAATKAGSR
jgi:hypothetical protein